MDEALSSIYCIAFPILLGNAEKYNVIFEGDSLTANDVSLSGNFADRTYNELGMQGTYVNHGTTGATMRKDKMPVMMQTTTRIL
jgi:hypothetical protein